MNPCLLIPVYDHGSEMGCLLESLESLSLPCIVVDDGSHDETRQTLDCLAVRYLAGGVSHFDMLGDNWRISWMHARLSFGMLRRLPRLHGFTLKAAHDQRR